MDEMSRQERCGQWERKFAKERELLRSVFGRHLITMHHIGSTALRGVFAQEVIDILVVLKEGVDAAQFAVPLQKLGFSPGSDASLWQGPSVHLFVYREGDLSIRKAIALKEYLLAHPEAAQDYDRVKKESASLNYEERKKRFLSSIQPLADQWKETQCE